MTTTTATTIEATEVVPATLAPTKKPRLHLDYLDGLRGLAALYVVFDHAYMNVGWKYDEAGISPWLAIPTRSLWLGFYAVIVFIVLSGFCLMLPVVRSSSAWVPGGLGGYLWRRCRRILPPYYASLGLALLLIALIPPLRQPHGAFFDGALPVTRSSVVAHALLVHNFKSEWFVNINPPAWSIAIEWQIYFLFPLLILAWRKFGVMASTVLAVVGSFAFHRIHNGRYDYSQPFFLGCFGFGMAGAAIAFSQDRFSTRLRRWPWMLLSCALLISAVALGQLQSHWLKEHWFVIVNLVGLATACLLIHCGIHAGSESERRPVVRRILETPWLAASGRFSYSLYLIHFPLLAICYLFVGKLAISADAKLMMMIFVAAPVVILATYPFHLIFERPFMSTAR